MVVVAEQDHCQMNSRRICFILKTMSLSAGVQTINHIGIKSKKHSNAHIKLGIEISSPGIHPVKRLFATLLLKRWHT